MRKQSGERQNFSKKNFAFFLELYLATLRLVAGIFYFIVTTLVIPAQPITAREAALSRD